MRCWLNYRSALSGLSNNDRLLKSTWTPVSSQSYIGLDEVVKTQLHCETSLVDQASSLGVVRGPMVAGESSGGCFSHDISKLYRSITICCTVLPFFRTNHHTQSTNKQSSNMSNIMVLREMIRGKIHLVTYSPTIHVLTHSRKCSASEQRNALIDVYHYLQYQQRSRHLDCLSWSRLPSLRVTHCPSPRQRRHSRIGLHRHAQKDRSGATQPWLLSVS